jgi:hypothetical protein
MMKRTCLTAAGAAVLIGLGLAPASVLAQQTGLAGMHQWAPVGRNKTCLATHFHNGAGTGKTKKDAERAAIQSWEAFTSWEYGASWGRFALSESKTINCDRTTASEYSCQVSSRPCISRIAKGRKR